MERLENKPQAKVIGADGNVYNIMGICRRALTRAGKADKASEMLDRVSSSNSYSEALAIMQEYVEFV